MVADDFKLFLCELQVVLSQAYHVVAVQLDGADHAEHDPAVGQSGLDPGLLRGESSVACEGLLSIPSIARQFTQ